MAGKIRLSIILILIPVVLAASLVPMLLPEATLTITPGGWLSMETSVALAANTPPGQGGLGPLGSPGPCMFTNSPTTNTGSWTNATNAYADGGGYANITSGTPSANHTFGNYSFNLTGSTITQVRVRYDAWSGISYIGSASTTGNNPTRGNFTLPAGWAANDVAVFWWYTYTNTKTFVKNGTGTGITTKQDVNASGYGHIFIGYRTLVAGDSTFAWTSSSVTNATTIWGTSVFRGVNGSGDPFENQSGAPATFTNATNPDPPAVTTITDKAWVYAVFGKRNASTSITPPSGYTTAGSNSSTAGNKSSAGTAYKEITPAGSEDPPAWNLSGGASTDDGYVWTGVLKRDILNEQIRVDVSWDGGTSWCNKQTTDLNGTETTYWYDVTSATTWTPDKLSNASFKVRADAYTVGYPSDVRLDWIPVEVTYETPGNISNTPPSYDFGTVGANSTYPTGLTTFNVTNYSGGPINISIRGTNMTTPTGFPQVAAENGGNNSTDTTSHTVNLPSGIASGDLLLVFFCIWGNSTVTFPSGWTQLFLSFLLAPKFGAWYRIADGTEGSTITVTTSNLTISSHTSYRVTNYSGTPEANSTTGGGSDAPDPPNLTPSWGAKDTLWFACCGMAYNGSGPVTVTAYPTSYTNGRNDYVNATYYASDGVARRELNAASENPGTFCLSVAQFWVTGTIAIQPIITTQWTLNDTATPGADVYGLYAGLNEWWNTSWQYRMPINITENSGSALTNYQVPITINTTTFNYSKANASGNDIRFATDSTQCDYWIETWNTSGQSKLWVEVPSLPANRTTTIYMYYGNSGASAASNGANTFLFFDDASVNNSANYTLRNLYNAGVNATLSWVNASSGYKITTTDDEVMAEINALAAAGAYRLKVSLLVPVINATTTNAQMGIAMRYSTSGVYYGRSIQSPVNSIKWIDICKEPIPPNTSVTILASTNYTNYATANTWYKAEATAYGNTLYFWHEHENRSVSVADASYGSGTWGIYAAYGPGAVDTYFKGISVGKYVSPELSVNLGQEEEPSAGENYTIVVKLNSPYNNLVTGLANGTSQLWGLKLCTPTSFSDAAEKSGTVTLTATCQCP